MADQPSSLERQDPANRGLTAGPPRWVKISAIITLALVVLLLILLLTGGNHGPGRHQSFRGYGGQLPSIAVHGWG